MSSRRLCDEGSVLELRRAFGPGMVTALARIEGKPFGIVANNPTHLAGAIDSDGSDKAARFLQLCDAFDLPVLFLCDTPGMMVGPEVEKTALVRHCSRLFVTGANLGVPFGTIVLRKAYGLGAQAMAGGSFHAGTFAISWPTGEFGGMGLEGAVKLGYRKELEAVERSGRAARAVRQDGGGGLCARQGAQHRDLLRGRRGDRPRRFTPLGGDGAARRTAAPAQSAQEAAEYRYVVDSGPRPLISSPVIRGGEGEPQRRSRRKRS